MVKSFLSESALTQLALLMVGVSLFVSTQGEYADVAAAQSPVFFPRVIFGLWVALSLTALIQDVVLRREVGSVGRLWVTVLFIAATLIYLSLVTLIGFALSSTGFALIALVLFGERSALKIGGYAVLAPGAIVLLFNHILAMPLPISPFTYLF